jgi:hypothetical protein
VYQQIVGVDPEFENRDTIREEELLLTNLPSGQTVKVYVVSANDAGEAGDSPEAQMVVP